MEIQVKEYTVKKKVEITFSTIIGLKIVSYVFYV